jgi:hypothetical protein
MLSGALSVPTHGLQMVILRKDADRRPQAVQHEFDGLLSQLVGVGNSILCKGDDATGSFCSFSCEAPATSPFGFNSHRGLWR